MSVLLGAKAPAFEARDSDGANFEYPTQIDYWHILFFYAKDGSPTCKRGCLTFKEQYNLFQSLDPPVEIIGISQDSVEDHRKFKQELGLPFLLLSDPDRTIAERYDVGMHLGRFPSKSSFVIDPDGIIRHVYDWLFRPRAHVAKILHSLSNVTRLE